MGEAISLSTKMTDEKDYSNVIPFPTLTEADKIRNTMGEMENAIKDRLDKLQNLNEDIVELTMHYETMLYRLCEITGVRLPEQPNWTPEGPFS
tara:strand:+ start:910 stop:1188 length:279 start_codon:yes stop_codon:yes gene_type:complete